MEKLHTIPYEVRPDRYAVHRMLDDWLDTTEKNAFIDGRKSGIAEIMPHTKVYQKANKSAPKEKETPPSKGDA